MARIQPGACDPRQCLALSDRHPVWRSHLADWLGGVNWRSELAERLGGATWRSDLAVWLGRMLIHPGLINALRCDGADLTGGL
jgi:hypothetical protein